MRVGLAFTLAAVGLVAINVSLLLGTYHEGDQDRIDSLPTALAIGVLGAIALSASLWSLRGGGRRDEFVWLSVVAGMGLGVMALMFLVS